MTSGHVPFILCMFLHATLCSVILGADLYLLESVFSCAEETNYFVMIAGMTKIKMSKEESGSADFVERRRATLERYAVLFHCCHFSASIPQQLSLNSLLMSNLNNISNLVYMLL